MSREPAGIDFVRVLGPIQMVSASGVGVDVPSLGQRRLLAVLALHVGRSVHSQRLADVLGLSPGALRNAVSRLRSSLGDGVLLTTASGYRLDIAVDADMFCRAVEQALAQRVRLPQLDRALAMWTGSPFGEFEDEAWAVGDVRRLVETHACAQEERAADLIAEERWSEAIASLSALVAASPFRDRPRGLLIRALAGAGRQADGLRAYHEYRAFLVEQVGTEPSAEVRALERRVAAGWNGREGAVTISGGSQDTDDRPARIPAVGVPLHGALTRAVTLVGRQRELTTLSTAFADSRTGGMRSVIVAGEPGIGKTTLIAAFASDVHASQGATVLYGRCDEGAAVPLQPFVGLVGWLVENAPIDVLIAHTARRGGALLRLAPHLGDRVDVAPPAPADEATERYVLFEAVADVLRRLAQRSPLVVILDDLHWAEPTANLLLRSLTRSLSDVALLLIAIVRDPGAPRSDELRAAIADLDSGQSRHVSLTGFDDAELGDLVQSITGVGQRDIPDVTEVLREETAGNPLYAAHLLRHWVETGRIDLSNGDARFAASRSGSAVPASLGDLLWRRVRALGAGAPEILSAAAVLGLEFRDDVLMDMLDVGESDVMKVLDDAVTAGLLVEVVVASGLLRFTHSLVWCAAYEELRPLQRTRLHRRAAQALQKSEDELSPKLVAQLARHCELGGLLVEAQRWASDAGALALAGLAPREAAEWYRKALDHATALGRPASQRVDLLVSLGEAQRHAGDPQALPTLYAAADLAAQCGSRAALVRAALATDRGFMRLGAQAPQQLRIIEAAIDVADQRDEASFTRLLALFGQSLVATPRVELRERVAHQAVQLAIASTDETLLARVARPLIYALWGTGAGSLRTRLVADAIAAADESADPFVQFDVHQAAYALAIETADPQAATRSLARLRSIAGQLDEPGMHWIVGIYDTFEATMAARFDDAERLATAMFDLGSLIGESDTFSMLAAQLFVVGTFAGRHDELFTLVEQAAADNPEILAFKLAYGIVCTAVQRPDPARHILAEGMAHDFANVPRDLWWMTSIIGYAVIAIELEDRVAAERLLPIIEPHCGEVAFNGATSQGPISAYVGKLTSLVGRHDVAERHLRDALSTATSFGWEYHRATTLIDLARCRFRRDGRLDEQARSWLRSAEVICEARGVRGWGARIGVLRAEASSTHH